MGCHALLQGIFPTQGSNSGLLHYRQILYHVSHQGSLYVRKVSVLKSQIGQEDCSKIREVEETWQFLETAIKFLGKLLGKFEYGLYIRYINTIKLKLIFWEKAYMGSCLLLLLLNRFSRV